MGRLLGWGAFAVACGAGAACSGFETPDCKESHTCASTPDASAGGSDAATETGGSGAEGGRGGSAAAGGTPGAGGSVAGGSAGLASTGGSAGMATSGGAAGSDADAGPSGATDAGDGGLICPKGFDDCDGKPGNGCESEVASDAKNCSACGHACSTAGTKNVACEKGTCKPACDDTHADCDGDPENGCEVDIGSDPDNCGACDYACSSKNTTGALACTDGVCAPTCATNFGDCTDPKKLPTKDDGCESDLKSITSCGACGRDCQGGACNAGVCQPYGVETGLTGAVDLVVDSTNIHWIDQPAPNTYAVRRVPTKVAGLPVEVGVATTAMFDLESDGTYVYWSVLNTKSSGQPADGSIVRNAIGDDFGSAKKIQDGVAPTRLAVAGSKIYWYDNTSAFIEQAPNTPAGPRTPLGSTQTNGLYLLTDGVSAYNHSGTSLYAVPLAGGQGQTVTNVMVGNVSARIYGYFMAQDKDHVYAWAFDNTTAHLLQLAKPGLTTPKDLATVSGTSPTFNALAAQGDYVYFAADGVISRVSISKPAKPESLATFSGGVVAMTFVDGALYWLDNGGSGSNGSVKRLAIF